MSGIGIEWLAVLVSIGCLAAVMLVEIVFLTRKNWTGGARATAFVLLTDIVWTGFAGMFVMVMVMFGLTLAFGPDGRGGSSPEGYYVVLVTATVVVPPVFLFLLKRGTLALLRIRSGSSAWVCSLVSTVLVIIGVFLLPGLLVAAGDSILS